MLRKIWLKGCMRCGGDLSLEQDLYGAYVACLQCGAVAWEPDPLAPTPQAVGERESTRVLVAPL